MKVIITGATGMVGEGVLFECLQNNAVSEVLLVSRKHYALQHPKLSELLVPQLTDVQEHRHRLQGFDACFFCAGVSSVGMKEVQYREVTYALTLAFARTLADANPGMVFTYVSGSMTDSSEQGRIMWARVKGKTENDLAKLPFRAEYNFRPGVMLPFEGQKNWKMLYRIMGRVFRFFSPKRVLSMQEVGRAMIHAVTRGYPANVLEVPDIRQLAQQ